MGIIYEQTHMILCSRDNPYFRGLFPFKINPVCCLSRAMNQHIYQQNGQETWKENMNMNSKEAELAGGNFRSSTWYMTCLSSSYPSQAGCASELLPNCMNHLQHLICEMRMTVMEDQAL